MKTVLCLLFCVYFGTICANTRNAYSDNNNTPSSLEKTEAKKYKADWKDLDTRPLPEWYDKAKIGIFLHWGVYSVPSFGSEWFWLYWNKNNEKNKDFMKKCYPPGFTYQEFAPMFTAEFFDPDAWAALFAKAGAKYVVLTSKHHDGFSLFPAKHSYSWNSVDVGPKRDIVKDLSAAVRRQNLTFGVYHSLYEWFNPIYTDDRANGFTSRAFPDTKLWPEITQLINDYQPSILWSDGDWEAYDTYWNSTGFLAWLYNDSPVKDRIVVNDRWGKGTACKHGDFYNCQDRYNPGQLQNHKWENAFTVDSHSWGYRRTMQMDQILTIQRMIKEIVTTVSCGGNVLINVGPTKEGTIAPIFQERLLSLGEWLEVNGEAIYDTSPWLHQNDYINDNVWYTCTKSQYNAARPTAAPQILSRVTATYAIFLVWPTNNVLRLKDITLYLKRGTYSVELLGKAGYDVYWRLTIDNGEVDIELPDKATVKSEYAWVLKFTTFCTYRF